MSDDISRALRVAQQAVVPKNALDQGDYGYGNPAQLPEPRFPFSSSAMEAKGPWMRDYMPGGLADFLAQVMTYAPMAVPAMRGRVMEGGLRPQDYAIGPAKDRAATKAGTSYQDEFQMLLSGNPKGELGSEAITKYGGFPRNGGFVDPGWADYRMSPRDMQTMQGRTPANRSEFTTEPRGPAFTRQEMERAGYRYDTDPKYRQEPYSPFRVIEGGPPRNPLDPEAGFNINAPLTQEEIATLMRLVNRPKPPNGQPE